MNGIRVSESTWPQVEQALARRAIAVLPIGAACKEHGRHLPMDTDQSQAEWLITQLLLHVQVVVWPVLGYGYYPVFVDYPSSISLSESTFMALLGDVLDGIEYAGARQIVVLNTGISTIGPIEKTLSSRLGSCGFKLINVYAGENFRRESQNLSEQKWGGHADEIETSIMLAIDERRVNLALAKAAPVEIIRGRFNRKHPMAGNYSPDGANGDPSLASVVKGLCLLAAMRRDVLISMAVPEDPSQGSSGEADAPG